MDNINKFTSFKQSIIHPVFESAKIEGLGLTYAKTGDNVKVGSPILKADLTIIKKAGYDTITPVIVVNTEHTVNKSINTIVANGSVTKGTKIIELVDSK